MVVLKHVVLDFNFQALLTSLKLNIEKVHIKKAEIVYSVCPPAVITLFPEIGTFANGYT